MSHVATKNFHRMVEETHAEIFTFSMTAEQALTLGYADLTAAFTALGLATIELVIPALTETVDCTVTPVQSATKVTVTIKISPPVELTDTAMDHDCHVVLESGSTTSERWICQGRWTVSEIPSG